MAGRDTLIDNIDTIDSGRSSERAEPSWMADCFPRWGESVEEDLSAFEASHYPVRLAIFVQRFCSRFCIAGHIIAVTSLTLAGFTEAISLPDFVVVLATLASVMFNRPAMYGALTMLRLIEEAMARWRSGEPTWKAAFFDLFPLSILLPPGDLCVALLLLMNIRAHTEHLDRRQYVVFKRAEIGFGIGAAIQYAALLIGATCMIAAGTGSHWRMSFIGWHAMTLAGVYWVGRSLQSMRRECSELVRLTRQLANSPERPLGLRTTSVTPSSDSSTFA